MNVGYLKMRRLLREAANFARVCRSPTFIIKRRPSPLSPLLGPFQVVNDPRHDDEIIVSGIAPERRSATINQAWCRAVTEVPDAIPAIRRVVDIVTMNDDGTPRSQDEIDEIMFDLIDVIQKNPKGVSNGFQ